FSRIHAPRKHRLTSERNARCATAIPKIANQASTIAPSPHWLGEHQARSLASIANAKPRLVGLKMCFPLNRTRNFELIANAAASGGIHQTSLLSSNESPSELISGDKYPAGGTFSRRVIPH